jgi:4-amino-4-deoxy-L-arabinose transferase-like glycosyltransferase
MTTVFRPDEALLVEAGPQHASLIRRSGVQVSRDVLIAFGLYLLALALLLFRLDSHPAYPHNWEHYTVWRLLDFRERPTLSVLRFDDGLMTDSGQSPLIVFPVWVASMVGLDWLIAMRLPVVLLSALAVPLLWIVGRRLIEEPAALLAAVLLALSPVFLLYGRTATTVGLSLVPALLTVYVLTRMLTGTWS